MLLYVIAIIYGVWIGNYVTTAYFRIPRLIPINGLNSEIGKNPHCSVCQHELKFHEYAPVLSWIFTRFKCNYCFTKINPMYFIIEASAMVSSVALYHFLGMNMIYMISVLIVAGIILNLSIFYTHYKLYPKAIYITLVPILAMIYKI